METHHKVIIGSFSTIVFLFMVVAGVLFYILFIQQTTNYNDLSTEIKDTQSKINQLTTNILQLKENLEESKQEIKLLKSTASEDFSGIIEDAIKSVVTIRTDVSQGTGFIIDEEGFIVTNAHVLVGGRTVDAINYEQEKINAELVGYSGDLDVALLKIPGNYEYLELADSDNVQIGEKVIAIGNPLGLQFSVTEGIVSAVDRTGINNLEAYIQTDAALNPGNSGGPLINKKGKVIGINNFKVGGGENLGFALESNYLGDVINQISEQVLNRSLV